MTTVCSAEPVGNLDEQALPTAWPAETLGPLRERLVALPRSGILLRILQPADLDRLLELAQDDPEDQLPYWAELWPSGIALADAIALDPSMVKGQRVVELGCGLGVTAAIALQAGAELLVTDYSAEALLLTALNCERNVNRRPSALRLNWRRPEEALFQWCGPHGVPVILAADVLYEARDIEPLLSLVRRSLTPGGTLWLAEPGRATAASFVERLLAEGWTDSTECWNGPWPDQTDSTVRVTVHRLVCPGDSSST